MAFMELELSDKGWHWWVETKHGAFVVPGDVVFVPTGLDMKYQFDESDPLFDALCALVVNYVEGDIQDISFRKGYCGRYQAPGHLDCTDWSFGTCKRELMADLRATYGD